MNRKRVRGDPVPVQRGAGGCDPTWSTGLSSTLGGGLATVHPHMLRHSAGHMLANGGADTRLIQDRPRHRTQDTVRYTELSQKRLASVRVR